MAKSHSKQVAQIRSVSRILVRELGFMSRHVAGTDLSPSAVHALVEIGLARSISANDIGSLLLLEKSSVSRLIQVLKKKSLVKEVASKSDARKKLLALTATGKRKLRIIDTYAESRISTALEHLSDAECRTVLLGLSLYNDSLFKGRTTTPSEPDQFEMKYEKN